MRFRILGVLMALGCAAPALAQAVSVHSAAGSQYARDDRADGRLVVDVWTDRGDGAVYHVGDPIRVHFRTSVDAYVVVYNVDTEGQVHLLYPHRRYEPHWVVGGREYLLPGARSTYDYVVDGPPGIEYIQVLASREPFQQLPDYLDADLGDGGYDYDVSDASWRERGRIAGDPFLGMERINRSILPYDCDEEDCYSASYTSFYVDRHVDYPRFLCADCHGPYADAYYDPYATQCSVFEIRVDYDWRWRRHYPFYRNPYWYYFRRANVAPRYYGYKQRWSSADGWVRFRDTFGERVLWKKAPDYDPTGGDTRDYFRHRRQGGVPERPLRGERRDRFRERPVTVPVQPVTGADEPVRFRSRSRDLAPPPRNDHRPPAEVRPNPGKPDDAPRRMERPRDEGRQDQRNEDRQRGRVAPEPRNPDRQAPPPKTQDPPRDDGPRSRDPGPPPSQDRGNGGDRGQGRPFYRG